MSSHVRHDTVVLWKQEGKEMSKNIHPTSCRVTLSLKKVQSASYLEHLHYIKEVIAPSITSIFEDSAFTANAESNLRGEAGLALIQETSVWVLLHSCK